MLVEERKGKGRREGRGNKSDEAVSSTSPSSLRFPSSSWLLPLMGDEQRSSTPTKVLGLVVGGHPELESPLRRPYESVWCKGESSIESFSPPFLPPSLLPRPISKQLHGNQHQT